MKRLRGFSLVELIIVLAVMAILVMMAFPSIRDYRIKSNRSAAKAVVMELASREKQYFIDAKAFVAKAANTSTVMGYTVPSDVEAVYSITITADATAVPPTFSITAAPKANTIQDGDGDLTIDYKGAKTGKW